jgi:hypothetical protein
MGVGRQMRARVQKRCPILIELGREVIKTEAFASNAEQPATVAIKVRESGWSPYRVRFDDSRAAWIVSSLNYRS